MSNKYKKECNGAMIDIYDILKSFEVNNPATQHAVKKNFWQVAREGTKMLSKT